MTLYLCETWLEILDLHARVPMQEASHRYTQTQVYLCDAAIRRLRYITQYQGPCITQYQGHCAIYLSLRIDTVWYTWVCVYLHHTGIPESAYTADSGISHSIKVPVWEAALRRHASRTGTIYIYLISIYIDSPCADYLYERDESCLILSTYI